MFWGPEEEMQVAQGLSSGWWGVGHRTVRDTERLACCPENPCQLSGEANQQPSAFPGINAGESQPGGKSGPTHLAVTVSTGQGRRTGWVTGLWPIIAKAVPKLCCGSAATLSSRTVFPPVSFFMKKLLPRVSSLLCKYQSNLTCIDKNLTELIQ